MELGEFMSLKDNLKYLFSIDTKSSNRVIIYIAGIRIRFIKPSVKEAGIEYIKFNCPVSEIPKAEGTLRKIQLADLKMMKIFDELCKENNFEYWLDFGNLLGAVRHKGFIPWDDDVDLGMPREDYEKFIELYKNGIPNYEDLYLEFNNNGKNKCFLKVLHKKLPNIAIDIFPYDYYYKKTNIEEKLKITENIGKVRNKFYYKLLCPFFINQPQKMRKRFKKLTNKYILENHKVDKNIEPSLFYGMDYPHPYDNYFFDYDKIFPLKTINYEGIDFPCPNDTDFVLTQTFGDYMQLPEKDCYPRHTNSNGFQGEEGKILEDFIK